jgi:hypothetical protein
MARLTGPYVGFPGDSARRTTTQEAPLGTRADAEGGKEYAYVQANGAIIAGSAVKLAASGTAPYDVVYCTEISELVFGVAEEAFADNEYGWVCTRGVTTCRLVDATAAGSLLVSSTADGVLKLATEAESLAGARAIVSLTSDANSDTVPVYIFIA